MNREKQQEFIVVSEYPIELSSPLYKLMEYPIGSTMGFIIASDHLTIAIELSISLIGWRVYFK